MKSKRLSMRRIVRIYRTKRGKRLLMIRAVKLLLITAAFIMSGISLFIAVSVYNSTKKKTAEKPEVFSEERVLENLPQSRKFTGVRFNECEVYLNGNKSDEIKVFTDGNGAPYISINEAEETAGESCEYFRREGLIVFTYGSHILYLREGSQIALTGEDAIYKMGGAPAYYNGRLLIPFDVINLLSADNRTYSSIDSINKNIVYLNRLTQKAYDTYTNKIVYPVLKGTVLGYKDCLTGQYSDISGIDENFAEIKTWETGNNGKHALVGNGDKKYLLTLENGEVRLNAEVPNNTIFSEDGRYVIWKDGVTGQEKIYDANISAFVKEAGRGADTGKLINPSEKWNITYSYQHGAGCFEDKNENIRFYTGLRLSTSMTENPEVMGSIGENGLVIETGGELRLIDFELGEGAVFSEAMLEPEIPGFMFGW